MVVPDLQMSGGVLSDFLLMVTVDLCQSVSMSLDRGQAEPNSSGSMVLAYGAAEQDARAQGCSEAEAVLCEPQGTLSSAPGSQRLTLLCSTCFLYDHFICY
jgi:hypothetical protein